MNVTKADSRASPTASGPSIRVSPRLAAGAGKRGFGGGSLFDAHKPLAADDGDALPRERHAKKGSAALPALMLLYNNVAELRQIRGLKRHGFR